MKRIEYIVETLSPVTFAQKNNDSSLYNTQKYVSGSIFRGMLANKFIRDKNLNNAHEDGDFYDIFLSGKVRFLPAYPIGKEIREGYEPFVLPLSLMKHKSSNNLKDISNGEAVETGYKKMTGFALKNGEDIYKMGVDTQIEFHMARNADEARVRGSNKDGRVFNYEYIEPYQFFKGDIIVDDDIADKVATYLQKVAQEKIYVGRSRNVQYGECKLSVSAVQECGMQSIDGNKKLYLYTYTPYIPLDEWQRVDLVAEKLCQTITEKLGKKIDCGDAIFAATEEYSGYVGVWKVRRERRLAISAGSLIEINLPDMSVETINELNEILYGGLGYRKEEGFGQFRLYQPLNKPKPKSLNEKIGEAHILSEAVKKQAKILIRERILLEIKNKAVKDADNNTQGFSGKTILNRIEKLVDSDKTKIEIQKELASFNSTATHNLHAIAINNEPLDEIMKEEKDVKLPYEQDWKSRIGLFSSNLGINADTVKADLGQDVFDIDEDTLYKTYFLWFVRHAKKVVAKKDA